MSLTSASNGTRYLAKRGNDHKGAQAAVSHTGQGIESPDKFVGNTVGALVKYPHLVAAVGNVAHAARSHRSAATNELHGELRLHCPNLGLRCSRRGSLGLCAKSMRHQGSRVCRVLGTPLN